MESIKFSKNWNYKLFSKHFTTIRLWSKKFQVGQLYNMQVPIHGQEKHIEREIECVSVTPVRLHDIPEYVWYNDTGMNKDDSIKMVETMYKNFKVNVHTATFAIIVFRQLNLQY